LLSVVTITWNNFTELVATLESVRGQTVELVVVNGGTCPQTKSLLDSSTEASLEVSRFRYVSEPDRGIADAFNKGIRLSSGDAIVFLNSGDVLISKTYFQRAMDVLERQADFGFVHSAIVFSDRLAGEIVLKPSLSTLGRGMPYRHQTMIVRRRIFDQLGGFDTNLKATMDYDFVCRMHLAGELGYYDQTEPTVKMDGTGISSTRELFAYHEVLKVLWSHGLMTPVNAWGTFVRYLTYFVRRGLEKLGMSGLLVTLKKWKHGV